MFLCALVASAIGAPLIAELSSMLLAWRYHRHAPSAADDTCGCKVLIGHTNSPAAGGHWRSGYRHWGARNTDKHPT